MNSIKPLHQLDTNGKLKVAAYARISRDKDDLENSLENQIRYYTTLIGEKQNWVFSGIYADDGISGGQIKKRNQFQLMISKAFNNEIDVILVKSISRFARNVIDLLSVIQELRDANVEVYFEKENISTLDTSSDTYLSMYAKFAEEELISMSKNVSWSIQNKMKRGLFYLDAAKLYGYMFDENRNIIINEKEAKWIRVIFQMYLEGANTAMIADYLERNNVKTLTKMDRWSPSSIRRIIRNEKYCGDVLLQKTYSESPLSKRRVINHGEKEKYLVEDAVSAIVSKSIWKRCQEIMDEKADKYKITHINVKSLENAYTNFGFCPYCRSNYFKKLNHGKRMLYCRSNKDRMLCKDSESVYAEHIDQIISLLVKKLKNNESSFRKDLVAAFSDNNTAEIDNKIAVLDAQLTGLRQRLGECENMADLAISALKEQLKKNIEEVTSQKLILENERLITSNADSRANEIIKELRAFPDGNTVGDYDFRKLFKKMIVINRDRLAFVVGSGDMDKIPLNPNTIAIKYIESFDYVIRSTGYTCHFGIYINK